MAYYSKARPWARGLTLVMSGPIAIISNVTRIFMVCVVGYFWGSQIAAGKFHDISGFCIFAIAFVLFAALEAVLRRWAPALPGPKTPATKGPGA
jgi:exosortase/archaeosortase family protein